MYKLTEWMGYLLIVTALSAGILFYRSEQQQFGNIDGYISVLTGLVVVSAFLSYASIERQKGTDIAVRLYPSSIAACILYALFLQRWLWYGAAQ